MSCPDCDGLDVGDVVEHKMNTNVVGIVIGFMGSLAVIRTSPTLEVLSFHECELRAIADDETPPSKAEPAPDNVIVVDFTKKQDLRGAKPAGRA